MGYGYPLKSAVFMLRCVPRNMWTYIRDGDAGFPAGTLMHRPGGLYYLSFLHASLWSWEHVIIYEKQQASEVHSAAMAAVRLMKTAMERRTPPIALTHFQPAW